MRVRRHLVAQDGKGGIAPAKLKQSLDSCVRRLAVSHETLSVSRRAAALTSFRLRMRIDMRMNGTAANSP
jgi:hypothetical protein